MVSQTELAKELGVTRQAVSNVEALLRPNPKAVERYMDALERVPDG
jgi:DNA-binding XRE family transcriptional regulator